MIYNFLQKCQRVPKSVDFFSTQWHWIQPSKTATKIKELLHQNLIRMVTTTIYVKPYLAAYMYVRYQNSVVTEFNAIRLKSIENLYHVIKNLTAKRPRNVSWRETGNLTLIIPDPRYGKDPETYNYLGHDSIISLKKK